MNTWSPAVLTFIVCHLPHLKEWVVVANEVQPHSIRFHDECSQQGGAPGLVGAIGHCFQMSGGKPSLLVIESQRQQFRLRFHSEPECVARFGSSGSGQPAQPHGDGIDGWQGRASVRVNEPRHQESHAA